MSVKNSYPELPELNYLKTKVEMGEVVYYLKSLSVPAPVKIAAYVMFRNESANGTAGINHNYLGIQADSGRWADHLAVHFVGTIVKNENMTGNQRRFLAFKSYEGSLAFLIDRIKARGLFVGGTTNKVVKMQINTPETWVLAYWREWVTGNAKAQIPDKERSGLLKMYQQGEQIFNKN